MTSLAKEIKETLGSVKYQPSVSVIMPFEPKLSLTTELEYRLRLAVDKVERQLKAVYTEEKSKPVTERLRALLQELDFDTNKKSIAIFVSPLVEKVYYLDIPVEEKIIIDESFEVRDLVYSGKELSQYFLLVLSSDRSKVYLGDGVSLVRIATDVADHAEIFENDAPERVSHFSDPSYRKEVLLDKFLKHVDEGIGQLIKTTPLPFFIMGAERTLGRFKKLSHYTASVIAWVHGNYETASEAELGKVLEPYIADWKKVKEADLHHRLEMAQNAGKLATGVQAVWKAATQKKGRLLVVEKNYLYPARLGNSPEEIIGADQITGSDIFIKDAVDDIIEKVLASGGDVEFVEEGMLSDHNRIALVEYY